MICVLVNILNIMSYLDLGKYNSYSSTTLTLLCVIYISKNIIFILNNITRHISRLAMLLDPINSFISILNFYECIFYCLGLFLRFFLIILKEIITLCIRLAILELCLEQFNINTFVKSKEYIPYFIDKFYIPEKIKMFLDCENADNDNSISNRVFCLLFLSFFSFFYIMPFIVL